MQSVIRLHILLKMMIIISHREDKNRKSLSCKDLEAQWKIISTADSVMWSGKGEERKSLSLQFC